MTLPKHNRPGGLNWREYAAVCERLKAGDSVTRIAHDMKRSEKTMHEWLRRLELIPAPVPRPNALKAARDIKRIPPKGYQFGLLDAAWSGESP